MAIGDIYLGAPASLRPYKLRSISQLVRSSANQMAAKIAQGDAAYDDQTSWSNWVMTNWQAGVGQKDPTGGGFLFATAETRFENQLFLPLVIQPLVESITDNDHVASASEFALRHSGSTGAFFTVGTGAITRVAELILVGTTNILQAIDVFLPDEPAGLVVNVNTYNVTAGLPTTANRVNTVTLRGGPGHSWYTAELSSPVGGGVGGVQAVVVYPASGTISVLGTTGGLKYNGSVWSAGGAGILARYHKNPNTVDDVITKVIQFPNATAYKILLAGGDEVHAFDGANITLAQLINNAGADVTDLLATGEKVFVGLGDSTNYKLIATDGTVTDGTVAGRLFALHKGFLWRAVGGSVFYTSNETTWTEVVVADPGYTVVGMHGFGDDLIVSTQNTLWRVTWGDAVRLLTDWGTIDASNGKHMVNFQGKLYISHEKSILQYDGDALLPFGLDLKEGLPADYHGEVVGLTFNNNWLIAAVKGVLYSTVWGHNGQGWHFISELPVGAEASAVGYISTAATAVGYVEHYENRLVVGTEFRHNPYRIALPDTARSNFQLAQDTNELYFFNLSATFETDWFFGSQREIFKDFESVYIDGENLDSAHYVEVYWQDEGSTDWELLGTIDSDGEELRWDIAGSTRPNARRIKLQLHLFSTTYGQSPVINAVRVKFMPMLFDRWRWTVPIEVAEDLTFLDGSKQTTHNVAAQITHLDGLTRQVPPFVLQDLDETQHEVKLLDSSRTPQRVRYDAGTRTTEWVYNLTLEEVVPEAYVP